MAQAEIITGAACRLLVNGVVVGFATSIAYTRHQGIKPIYGIDNPLFAELAITGPYHVRGSITGLRTRFKMGFDGSRMVNASTLVDYFNQQYCTIELIDRKTGVTFAKIDKVLFHDDTVNVSAKGLVTISAQFTGLWLSTELSAK